MADIKKRISKIFGQNGEESVNREKEGNFLEKELPDVAVEKTDPFVEKEKISEEVVDKDKLLQKAEKIDLDEDLKIRTQSQANSIKSLQDEEKIKKLLDIAKKKGVVYAINVAKKMNNPYILDTLHDVLAKEEFYKKMEK